MTENVVDDFSGANTGMYNEFEWSIVLTWWRARRDDIPDHIRVKLIEALLKEGEFIGT